MEGCSANFCLYIASVCKCLVSLGLAVPFTLWISLTINYFFPHMLGPSCLSKYSNLLFLRVIHNTFINYLFTCICNEGNNPEKALLFLADTSIEFGTAVVYTCEKSCWIAGCSSPLEEFIFVQEDPDQQLFK